MKLSGDCCRINATNSLIRNEDTAARRAIENTTGSVRISARLVRAEISDNDDDGLYCLGVCAAGSSGGGAP